MWIRQGSKIQKRPNQLKLNSSQNKKGKYDNSQFQTDNINSNFVKKKNKQILYILKQKL